MQSIGERFCSHCSPVLEKKTGRILYNTQHDAHWTLSQSCHYGCFYLTDLLFFVKFEGFISTNILNPNHPKHVRKQ